MKFLTDFSKYVITTNTSLLDAMEQLDKATPKILYLTENDKLVASLTDGDIRRWILKTGNLNVNALQAANMAPKCVHEENVAEAEKLMTKHGLCSLPQVNHEGKIVSLIVNRAQEGIKSKELINTPVVIMAGGIGSRLYPYTKILPKPLIPIGDVPIIERIIQFFVNQGCRRFYVIVNYKKNMIKAYFNEVEHDYDIIFIDEDIPLGTGGGLSLLKGLIQEPFILTNCDNIINIDFSEAIKIHHSLSNTITVLSSVQKVVIPYGVIHTKENGSIDYMEEKPALPYLINTGCYIVNPEVIEGLVKDQKIDFPSIITKQLNNGRCVGIYPINSEDFLDMGQFDAMEKMKNVLHVTD